MAQLRSAVFDGTFKPGDPLGSEADLAAQFGVSRLSVREAMRSLEASGLVEVRLGPKGGARVAHGDPQRFAEALAIQLRLVGVGFAEVLDAQAGLEQMAARLAARNATEEDLDHLESLLRSAQSTLEGAQGLPDRTPVTLGNFHALVADASHNPVVIATLIAVREAGDQQRPSLPEAQHLLEYHQAIFEAIKSGEADRAGELMYAHALERRRHLDEARPR